MGGNRSKQLVSGKSFEYALLLQTKEKLSNSTQVEVLQNSSLTVAKEAFQSLTDQDQAENLLYASVAINCLINMEPPRFKHN